MKITGTTITLGIFGDPIEHTLSPTIQNAAFEHLGLDMAYLPFHVSASTPGALKAAVEGVKALGMRGVNVTIPHKESVMEHLDAIDPGARAIKAVNTVVNKDGRLIGYNTDGEGYLVSLRDELGFTPRGKNIVIIGAGGASRAVFHAALTGEPASVVIANRTVKRAESLAAELTEGFKGVEVKVTGLGKDALTAVTEAADLVVNTTSAGMSGSAGLDFPVDSLPDYAVVSDIVYKPLDTPLILKAEERGLRVHKGLGMLVRQGALGFTLWTGMSAPVEVMQRAAEAALGIGGQ